MNGSGVLMLAVGLVAGLMLGQALKVCPTATGVPPKGTNFWDVLVAGLPNREGHLRLMRVALALAAGVAVGLALAFRIPTDVEGVVLRARRARGPRSRR